MLDESDPAIERELAHRKEGSLKEKEDKTASQKWPSQHMQECEKRLELRYPIQAGRY
jgi:hypothetical protein